MSVVRWIIDKRGVRRRQRLKHLKKFNERWVYDEGVKANVRPEDVNIFQYSKESKRFERKAAAVPVVLEPVVLPTVIYYAKFVYDEKGKHGLHSFGLEISASNEPDMLEEFKLLVDEFIIDVSATEWNFIVANGKKVIGIEKGEGYGVLYDGRRFPELEGVWESILRGARWI